MMQMSESITELAAALAQAQGEMENAAKNAKNPHFKSSYADLAEIVNATRQALAKHGLSLTQSPGYSDGIATVTTLLMHSSGQWLMDTAAAPVGKQDAQGIGSVTTYLRRYARAAFCGLAQEDDDGNAASRREAQQPMIAPKLQAEIDACKASADNACTKEDLLAIWNEAHAQGYLEHVAEHIKTRKAALKAAPQ